MRPKQEPPPSPLFPPSHPGASRDGAAGYDCEPSKEIGVLPGRVYRLSMVPEVLHMITGELDRNTQVACTRVSRIWSNIALDYIWQDLATYTNILSILSPMQSSDNGLVFMKDVTAERWARFDTYARRVKSLVIKQAPHLSSGMVIQLLCHLRSTTTGDLLPTLKGLHWSTAANDTISFLPFVNQTLNVLTLDFSGSTMPSDVNRALQMLSDWSPLPRLQRLFLFLPKELNSPPAGLLIERQGQGLLELRCCGFSLPPAAKLPQIVKLRCRFFKPYKLSSNFSFSSSLQIVDFTIYRVGRLGSFGPFEQLLSCPKLQDIKILGTEGFFCFTPHQINAMGRAWRHLTVFHVVADHHDPTKTTPLSLLKDFARSSPPTLTALGHGFAIDESFPTEETLLDRFPRLEYLLLYPTSSFPSATLMVADFLSRLCPLKTQVACGKSPSQLEDLSPTTIRKWLEICNLVEHTRKAERRMLLRIDRHDPQLSLAVRGVLGI